MILTVVSGVSYVLRATRKLHAGSFNEPALPDVTRESKRAGE
jgi:hypothetical protein